MGNSMATARRKPGDAKLFSKKGGDKQMAYLTTAVESIMKKGLNSLSAMDGRDRPLLN